MRHRIPLAALSLVTIGLLLGAAPGCAGRPASSPPAESRTAEEAPGAALHRRYCGNCHGLPAPSRYGDAAWGRIMKDMAPQAGLGRRDATVLLDWLRSVNDG